MQLILHPVIFIFVTFPLLSIIFGALLHKFKWTAVLVSFFIPPIFFIIVSGWDLHAIFINFDAWIVYGTFYAIIAYITAMITKRRKLK